MTLPYIIREQNHCSYPLHPSANYRGEGYHRWLKKIPPTHHVVLFPSWDQFVPGQWHWCPRCARRNAARQKTVKRLAEKALTLRELARIRTPKGERSLRLALTSWGGQNKVQIGGRFVTFTAQTRYARRHAPLGQEWCSYGLHYSPVAEMAHVLHYRKAGYCEACYRRYIRGQQMRLLFRWQGQRDRERQAFQEFQGQRMALRREIADLRRLKEAIAQEIVTTQHQQDARALNENEAGDYAMIVDGGGTTGAVPFAPEALPIRGRADRRKAYSV